MFSDRAYIFLSRKYAPPREPVASADSSRKSSDDYKMRYSLLLLTLSLGCIQNSGETRSRRADVRPREQRVLVVTYIYIYMHTLGALAHTSAVLSCSFAISYRVRRNTATILIRVAYLASDASVSKISMQYRVNFLHFTRILGSEGKGRNHLKNKLTYTDRNQINFKLFN